MIVYKCIVTGDEMFSDSYKITEIQDVLYEVEAKLTTEKNEGIDDSLIGGNKSAEEPDEGAVDDSSKSGPNVAIANRYVETGFSTKKEYLQTMKAYFKAALDFQKQKAETEKKEFDEDAFKNAHSNVLKNYIIPMYNDLQFYTGESLNPEGTIPLLVWRKKEGSEEETPFFYYFKSGLKVEKY